VQAGNITMKSGSKIIGINSFYNPAAIYVTGINSSFTMEGGEINSNQMIGVDIANSATFVMSGGRISGNDGGVSVNSNATFNMSGGMITGNSGYDVMNNTLGAFTLTGNAEIGVLRLDKANNGANGSITIGAGGFTGVVSTLNLYVNNSTITNVRDQWTTGAPVPTVINGAVNASVISRFTLGRFLGSGSATLNISDNYKLDIIDGVVKLVWR